MLVDANILLYAAATESDLHAPAKEWLEDQLNGDRRVGLPMQSLSAFLRIATNPRAFSRPLTPQTAWGQVLEWLDATPAWTPEPGPRFVDVFGDLIVRHRVRADLVPDAQLAALAIENGLTVCSVDSDFARFDEVRWLNPLAV